MTELERIFLTSALTIFGGVIVFVSGQIINEFIIKPLLNYKKVIAEIDEELIFYSNIYSNAGQFCIEHKEICSPASDRLRRLACSFSSAYKQLSAYNKLSVTDKDKVMGDLIFLSNSLWRQDNIDHNLNKSEEIRKILKI